jgi:hypothetical protein
LVEKFDTLEKFISDSVGLAGKLQYLVFKGTRPLFSNLEYWFGGRKSAAIKEN